MGKKAEFNLEDVRKRYMEVGTSGVGNWLLLASAFEELRKQIGDKAFPQVLKKSLGMDV